MTNDEMKRERQKFELVIQYRQYLGRHKDGSYECDWVEGRWQGWLMHHRENRVAEQLLGNCCTEVIVEDGQLNATQRQLEECQQELLSLKLALLREGYPC